MKQYYAYWQVFMLAELVNTGYHVFFNAWDGDLSSMRSSEGNYRALPIDRVDVSFNAIGIGGFKELSKTSKSLEAVSFYEAYTGRAYNVLLRRQKPCTPPLRGKKRGFYEHLVRQIAKYAVARWEQTEPTLLETIRCFCLRWDEATRAGRVRLAEAHKLQIRDFVDLYCTSCSRDYNSLVHSVGRVTGHAGETLDAVFPDWVGQQRQRAVWFLDDCFKEQQTVLEPIGFHLTASARNRMLNWIEEHGLFGFHWFFDRATELWFKSDPISLVGFRREIVSISLFMEYFIDAILADSESGTAKPASSDSAFPVRFGDKLARVWKRDAEISCSLRQNRNLTQTKPGMVVQLARIAAIAEKLRKQVVAKELLRSTLIRNAGVHLDLLGIRRPDQVDLLKTVVRCVGLTWIHAKEKRLA